MNKETIHEFRKTIRKFEREINIGLKDDPRTGGLNMVQCHTIINLGNDGEVSIGEMAKELGVDKSTLSRTVDGLVNIGLVDRCTHPSDRRYLMIDLTEQGRVVCKKINKINNDYFADIFSTIPKEEHKNTIKYLNVFISALVNHGQKRTKS